MPLTNLYINNYQSTDIMPGSTTGTFGNWDDVGIEWPGTNFPSLAVQNNLFTNGVLGGVMGPSGGYAEVDGMHTGGLPRAYIIELTPQVPEGVTYPAEGFMSFCYHDLTISGHSGSMFPINNFRKTEEFFGEDYEYYNHNADITRYFTHEANPLWQTEYDPYHVGSSALGDIQGSGQPTNEFFDNIIHPANMDTNAELDALNLWHNGHAIKYWNEETVKSFGDQNEDDWYTSIAPGNWWDCDEYAVDGTLCLEAPFANALEGATVEAGQDAVSLWDSRVSHVVAFNSQQTQYLGATMDPVRSHAVDSVYSTAIQRTIGTQGNKVYVVVVLKDQITWNSANIDLLGNTINVDLDGNAFFVDANTHTVLEPGDPVADEDIDLLGGDPGGTGVGFDGDEGDGVDISFEGAGEDDGAGVF